MRVDIDRERALARLAAKQHQLVHWEQARSLGLSSRVLRRRIAAGRLQMFRPPTVLALPGGEPTRLQAVMGVVLAGGLHAFASHTTAAWLDGLPIHEYDLCHEVTVVLGRCPRIEGVIVHRSGRILDRDVTAVAGIPTTTSERTIVDLSSRLSLARLGAMTDDAVRRGLTTHGRIAACAERLGRAPGRSPAKVHRMLAARVPGLGERESALEDFVYESIRRFGLPLPRCQQRVSVAGKRYRVDFCYPDLEPPVVIEADGFDTHGRRAQFDHDHVRGNGLELAGYRRLGFTSSFTDWAIAADVARAIGEPIPPRPVEELTFAAWCDCT
jgi:hypothetical protein